MALQSDPTAATGGIGFGAARPAGTGGMTLGGAPSQSAALGGMTMTPTTASGQ